MADGTHKVLLIGYGNPGRLDDGLGPALAAAVEKLNLAGVTVEADYQLTVEDAHTVAAHDVVIFADAAVAGTEPFFLRRLEPKREIGFSTHGAEPAEVLALARELFGARTQGYVLGIRGYVFNEFGERLSGRAQANLTAAAGFLERAVREGTFSEVGTGPETASAPDAAGSNGDTRCTTTST